MPIISPIYYVIAGIITTVTAQIILKLAGQFDTFKIKWFLFIFISLFSYAISFISYYMALKYFDISKIGPIMVSSTVALIALYGFATGEPFNNLKISGIVLAIISIFLIART